MSYRTHATRLGVVAGMCLAFTANTITGATAQVAVDVDATGDLAQRHWIGPVPVPDAVAPAVDITGAVVRHGETRIKVRANLDDLAPLVEDIDPDSGAFPTLEVNMEILTNLDLTGYGYIVYNGAVNETQGYMNVDTRRDLSEPCESVRFATNVEEDYIILSFPRACFNNPEWIKVRVWSRDENNLMDDAFRDSPYNFDAMTNEPKFTWSPRVYSGDSLPINRRHSQTLTEPTGDAEGYGLVDGVTLDAADQTTPDITSGTFRYGDTRVFADLKFADLKSTPNEAFEARVDILTDERKLYELQFRAIPSNPEGTVQLYADMGTINYRHSDCESTAVIDYEADTVSFSVPRWCLSKPQWVRMAAYASVGSGNYGISDPYYSFTDDLMMQTPAGFVSYTNRLYRS